MIERFDWSEFAQRTAALSRPRGRDDPDMLHAVSAIVEDIRTGGWESVVAHARRIDGSEPRLVAVAPFAEQGRRTIASGAQEAMALAKNSIEHFHRATSPEDVEVVTFPGVRVAKRWRPLSSAGLYIPGGRASLFSTLLMLAVPARVAGVARLTVVTPPRPGGGLDPAVALAAEASGIEAIWTIGGAQAIAALAFGAGEIERVDRICGPGNAWVAAAKALVSSLPRGPGIDLPAGPSELIVIADDGADADLIAADLLSQAEHGAEAQVMLVSTSVRLIDAVETALDRQAASMGGAYAPVRAILCASLEEAVAIANDYAPEHLSLATEQAEQLVGKINNAGAIFCGQMAAESFGDYLAGSSHVLPTDGAARFTGGVSVTSFMKAITVQQLTACAAAALAAPTAALARLEGLEAHARAAEARAS